MSILFGYDYFDTTAEDLNTLKQKLTTVEKAQQGNMAEVAKHANDIIKLNSLGENTVQYDFSHRIVSTRIFTIYGVWCQW
jgi:hypothetical protein